MAHPDPDELRLVPLLETLTRHQVAALAARMKVESFRSGEVLARQGDTGRAFYLILDGAAEVSVQDTVVGWLFRHDFFGELALLGDGRRHATVTALESGVACSMDRKTFAELTRTHGEIAAALRATAQDRHDTDARLLVR